MDSLQALNGLIVERQQAVSERNASLQAAEARIAAIDARILLLSQSLVAVRGAPHPGTPSNRTAAEEALEQQGEFLSKQDFVLAYIRVNGALDLGHMADRLYGADSHENRQRISRTLSRLKKKKIIRQLRMGVWEIRDPADED